MHVITMKITLKKCLFRHAQKVCVCAVLLSHSGPISMSGNLNTVYKIPFTCKFLKSGAQGISCLLFFLAIELQSRDEGVTLLL